MIKRFVPKAVSALVFGVLADLESVVRSLRRLLHARRVLRRRVLDGHCGTGGDRQRGNANCKCGYAHVCVPSSGHGSTRYQPAIPAS